MLLHKYSIFLLLQHPKKKFLELHTYVHSMHPTMEKYLYGRKTCSSVLEPTMTEFPFCLYFPFLIPSNFIVIVKYKQEKH